MFEKLKGMIVIHNRDIPTVIREENEAFNNDWIVTRNLVGDTPVQAEELDVDSLSKADAHAFMVVWLKNVERLLSLIPNDYKLSDYAVIDVGCGSGISTLYLHSQTIFKNCSGFDLSPNLIHLANENKQRYQSFDGSAELTKFYVADATTTQLKNQPTVLFLFNPFGWDTMKAFIENNIQNLKESNSLMLYANDIYIEELKNYGKIANRNDFFNLSVITFGK